MIISKKPASVSKILLIRLDHIGDLVYATAIPENLKNRFPEAKVTFLTGSWSKGILTNNPFVDEVIYYDAPWFSRKKKKIFGLFNFLQFTKQLGRYKFDLGLDLRGDFRHILLMALAGVKFRAGYGITGGGFLLDYSGDYKDNAHALERNLDLLSGLAIPIVTRKPKLYFSARAEDSINTFLKQNNITGKDRLFIIHPAAGYQSKNWRNDRFASLIKNIVNTYKAKIVLVGSAQDKAMIDEIISLSGSLVVNAAGKTSIEELVVLLQKASLFLGIDSGPSHIAAAQGVPTIVLYSATNKKQEWAPLGENVRVIQKEIGCRGCQSSNCGSKACMELITVEEVLDVIKNLLAKE